MGVQRHREGKYRISAKDPATGKRRTKVVEADSIEAARAHLCEFVRTIEKGRTPTLSEAWRYCLERGSRREVTNALYRKQMELYVDPIVGHQLLPEVDGQAIAESISRLARTTQRNIRGTVRALVREASREWRIEYVDPFRWCKFEREPIKRHEVGVDVDSLRLLAREGSLMIRVALNCGLRPAELRGLKVEDIDGELVHIRRSRVFLHGQFVNSLPKTGRTRAVRVGQGVASDLADYLRESNLDGSKYLFPVGHHTTLKKRLHEDCDRLGIKRLRPYDLRHGAAILLARSGAPVIDIARHLGHANLATTEAYLGSEAAAATVTVEAAI